MDYQRYLASREWALKREQVRERAKNQCERCHFAPMQSVHHLTYERIGREPLSDLLGVCNPCHEFLSGKSSRDPSADYGKIVDWLVHAPDGAIDCLYMIVQLCDGSEAGQWRRDEFINMLLALGAKI